MRSLSALLALAVAGCGAAPARPDLRAVAREIGSASAEHAAMGEQVQRSASVVRATVRLGTGEEVRLVEEDGALHVESGVLGRSASSTPADAISALHRALTRELQSGLGEVLAEPARTAWREERERYRDGTRYPEALVCTVDGGRAHALTPMGDEIELVQEGNAWRVVRMHAQEANQD